MRPELHPWINSPEARTIARRAVSYAHAKLPYLVRLMGRDELESEALALLTECALPQRNPVRTACAHCGGSLAGVRKGAKFCKPGCRASFAKNVERHQSGKVATRGGRREESMIPNEPQGHVGSMHTWPVDDMEAYAVKEVGWALCNYLRTGGKGRELAASETIANMSLANPEPDLGARAFLIDWLEAQGLKVEGTEGFDELAEAAMTIKGFSCFRQADTWADYVNDAEKVAA